MSDWLLPVLIAFSITAAIIALVSWWVTGDLFWLFAAIWHLHDSGKGMRP